MLSSSIVLLILSICSAFVGFGDEGGSIVPVAKMLFFVFLTAAIVTALIGKGSERSSSNGR